MIWSKIESCGVVVLASVLLFCVLFYGYKRFLDGTVINPVMMYDTRSLRADKEVYRPGEVVSVFLDLAKLRDVPGRITWSLVDGRVFPYATRELRYPVGSYEKWVALDKERLPTSNLVPDGAYHFEAVVEKDVNPFRTVYYRLVTDSFKISCKAQEDHQ
jgi:hypothetical protein